MADQDLMMKALNALADSLGKKIVVNPPSDTKKDWSLDSDAVTKDQKGDSIVTVKSK